MNENKKALMYLVGAIAIVLAWMLIKKPATRQPVNAPVNGAVNVPVTPTPEVPQPVEEPDGKGGAKYQFYAD